jgi:hypothetical protein
MIKNKIYHEKWRFYCPQMVFSKNAQKLYIDSFGGGHILYDVLEGIFSRQINTRKTALKKPLRKWFFYRDFVCFLPRFGGVS